MDRFIYIASNLPLEELKNPYVTYYTVKEALDKGIEIDPEAIKGAIGVKEKNAVAYCEDEDKLGYPCIYEINKKQYRHIINSAKKYAYKLDMDLTLEYADIVIDYIKKCLNTANEIELYSVLVDEEKENKISATALDELSADLLLSFLSEDISVNMLKITK